MKLSKPFIATTIQQFINENLLPEGSFADALRKDLIDQYLKNIEDSDTKEELSEEPDLDLLLEPDHYEGYQHQTYIQYVDDNTFKYYEGFSKLCWNGFKKQNQYKGMNEESIIDNFIANRAKNLGLEFGYALVDSEYFIHESWDYTDYILILIYKK